MSDVEYNGEQIRTLCNDWIGGKLAVQETTSYERSKKSPLGKESFHRTLPSVSFETRRGGQLVVLIRFAYTLPNRNSRRQLLQMCRCPGGKKHCRRRATSRRGSVKQFRGGIGWTIIAEYYVGHGDLISGGGQCLFYLRLLVFRYCLTVILTLFFVFSSLILNCFDKSK